MPFTLASTIAILERTPAVLTTMLAGLGPEWTAVNEGPDSWSPFDVIGHLINGEESDWLPRARIILSQGPHRRFPAFYRFRHLAENGSCTLPDLLERFATLRARNVADLKALNLSPADLLLTGEHPAFGLVRLDQLLATWTVHDLDHISQIVRVMATQYHTAVGPWIAYLGVLHPRTGKTP